MTGHATRVLGIIGVLTAFAIVATLDGSLQGSPVAEAGWKKVKKGARHTAKKTKKSAKKVGNTVEKTVTRTADKVAAQVTGAFSKAMGKVLNLLKPKGDEPELPKIVPGMFDKLDARSTFSWTNAYLLTLAAKISYNRSITAAGALKTMGLTRFSWINQGASEALVASNDKDVVVALRGTQFSSVKDILTDVRIAGTLQYGGKVHLGVYRAISLVISRVVQEVKKQNPAGTKAVWLTGHSLGGGLACLAAEELIAAGVKVRAIYTQGQLKVGDASFVKAFQIPLYRLVNENDPVPYLPMKLDVGAAQTLPFRHGGTMYFFDTKGRYQKRQSLPGFTLGRATWIIRNGFPSPHDMGVYLNRIRNQLAPALQKAWPQPF